ncbi:MAG: rubrerythrin [Desulfuromonadales bacterium]|nr:rubrerythrin [Desulfuromonadales bacterium]
MPEFANPFAGLAARRPLSREELVRAIRFLIAAEYEAVQLYMQLAESTDHRLAQVVLKDIADEEIVHAGEFLTLLKELAPEEAAFYAEGEDEVREMMAKLAGGASVEEAVPEKVHTGPEADGNAAQEPVGEPPRLTVGHLYSRD